MVGGVVPCFFDLLSHPFLLRFFHVSDSFAGFRSSHVLSAGLFALWPAPLHEVVAAECLIEVIGGGLEVMAILE